MNSQPWVRIHCNGEPISAGVVPMGSAPFGHYVSLAVVTTAIDLGWADTHAAGAAETYDEHYSDEDWPYTDQWQDMVDEAEHWLNDNTTGGLWHWADGDFRVDVIGECPECGDLRFTDPDIEDTECGGHLDWG
jgi:hypothetical protein